jgi:hypothetical protein
VIPLKGVVPLAPGALQTAQVNIPYRHTSGTIRVREFDNKGNEGAPANIAVLRDPEDAGYNDWVDVLTNGRPPIQPGDFRHLIFGFVWSVEYRQRFGP